MWRISVVVPVFNAKSTLRELHDQLTGVLPSIANEFEIVMVEDCGSDESWQIIQELAEKDVRVTGIKLARNFGQHNALLCGIRAARYDTIVTIDDDLQHPVSEITTLLEKLQQGYDVVYGAPKEEQHGFLRNAASQLTKLALKGAMGVENARNVSAFRAFKTSLRDAFDDYRSSFVSVDVLLTWGTANFGTVKVPHLPRAAGQSNYTTRKLIAHAFNLLTGFSTLPLQLASIMGFLFTLFGFLVLAWVLLVYVTTDSPVPGFAFLASIIAIFSGAQLFALGIFGEYLARIHFRILEKPTYVVQQKTAI